MEEGRGREGEKKEGGVEKSKYHNIKEIVSKRALIFF